jgi:hypothetical protein
VWRRPERVLDRETVDGIIRKLMEIGVKLAVILEHFGLSDEEADDDDA